MESASLLIVCKTPGLFSNTVSRLTESKIPDRGDPRGARRSSASDGSVWPSTVPVFRDRRGRLFAGELGKWKRVTAIDQIAVIDATRLAVEKMR